MASDGTVPADPLLTLRELVAVHGIRVVVSDLDGVLRVFDPALWDELDAMTGTAAGTSMSAILGHPYLDEVVRGRGTHARWRELAAEQLVWRGVRPPPPVRLWTGGRGPRRRSTRGCDRHCSSCARPAPPCSC